MKQQSIFPVKVVTGFVLLALAGGNALAAADEDEKILFLGSDGKELRSRQILNKGDTLAVHYDSCVITGKIQFKETERNSQIHNDVIALAKKVMDPKSDAPPKCGKVVEHYTTRHKRSLLVLNATDAADKPLGTKTLIVGPNENLSLSLDLPVGNRKTLKYDSASGKLLPQDEAPLLYLGLNFTPGDVLTAADEATSWKDRVSVKLLIEASSHPLDSYGVAVGYRLSKVAIFDVEGLSVFGGYFRAKEDLIAGNTVQVNQGRKNSWRVGLSYDLSTAMKWAKF